MHSYLPALFIVGIQQSNPGFPDKKGRDVPQFHRAKPGRKKSVCNILWH